MTHPDVQLVKHKKLLPHWGSLAPKLSQAEIRMNTACVIGGGLSQTWNILNLAQEDNLEKSQVPDRNLRKSQGYSNWNKVGWLHHGRTVRARLWRETKHVHAQQESVCPSQKGRGCFIKTPVTEEVSVLLSHLPDLLLLRISKTEKKRCQPEWGKRNN